MENDDGDTVLNATFDTDSGQHHPQTPVNTSPLRCQSTPPQTGTARMQETPVPAVPATSHRPMAFHIPLPRSKDSSSSLSQMSTPLFTEDRCSSSSNDDLEVCNAEVMLINRQHRPNQTFMNHSTGGRPTSMPSTMDYTTQGDPSQVTPPIYTNTAQATTHNQFFRTNNFFIPDGSNRHIHEIRDKVFHTGYLEKGNNAYLLELLGLKDMLQTSKFLMDEMSGQVRSTPPLNQSLPTASTTCNQDDILSKKPAPKTVQYQPPAFNLERPTVHLTMEERIQVYHNYISAVSNREHKKDLINRLKRSDPHNIPAYEAEMTHHMVMHDDVLERILTILKQDDYYRTLEELPVIDGLTTYNDIKLFPKLYDTTTIIERVTGEADLIE